MNATSKKRPYLFCDSKQRTENKKKLLLDSSNFKYPIIIQNTKIMNKQDDEQDSNSTKQVNGNKFAVPVERKVLKENNCTKINDEKPQDSSYLNTIIEKFDNMVYNEKNLKVAVTPAHPDHSYGMLNLRGEVPSPETSDDEVGERASSPLYMETNDRPNFVGESSALSLTNVSEDICSCLSSGTEILTASETLIDSPIDLSLDEDSSINDLIENMIANGLFEYEGASLSKNEARASLDGEEDKENAASRKSSKGSRGDGLREKKAPIRKASAGPASLRDENNNESNDENNNENENKNTMSKLLVEAVPGCSWWSDKKARDRAIAESKRIEHKEMKQAKKDEAYAAFLQAMFLKEYQDRPFGLELKPLDEEMDCGEAARAGDPLNERIDSASELRKLKQEMELCQLMMSSKKSKSKRKSEKPKRVDVDVAAVKRSTSLWEQLM